MSLSAEMLFFIVLAAFGAVAAAVLLACGLVSERQRPQRLRALYPWSAKGLLLPLILWALMNLGLSWQLQPFMPEVQAAQNCGAGWWPVYLRFLALGLFVVSSYWAAVTLGWAVVEAHNTADQETRAQFRSLCLTCFVAMILPAALLMWTGGWMLLGLAGIALLGPMAGYGQRVLQAEPTTPMYARAVARLKFGKYSEAEWEIIRELEKCEDDFEGWMMLASLYADQFHDLAQAEQTIIEVCDQPRTTASQLAVALHRLADWQLQRAGNPAAARGALQMICDRLPGTHLAHMAQLRMNQLPVNAAQLRRQQSGERIPLPALGDSIDEQPAPAESEADRRKAAQEANDCVEVLKADPKNLPAREKLARLFAERLDQPDLGIEQINLLLEVPDQPDIRRAEWLALMAAWQIRYRRDPQAGRALLERLLQEFPHTPQAFAARRRLQLLEAEAKSHPEAG